MIIINAYSNNKNEGINEWITKWNSKAIIYCFVLKAQPLDIIWWDRIKLIDSDLLNFCALNILIMFVVKAIHYKIWFNLFYLVRFGKQIY